MAADPACAACQIRLQGSPHFMRMLQKYMIEHALYPAMERRRGNQIRAKLRALQAAEHTPPDAIRAQQAERLRALLLHCARQVPAYRSLGLTEDAIKRDPLACLSQIPPLQKHTFQAEPERYLAETMTSAPLIPNHTGGSTGEPVHFFMTRDQVESYEAARWRGLSWYGVTPGSRSMMIWGNPIELSQNAQRRHRMREQLLKNRRLLSAYQLSPDTIAEHVRQIERYRPEYLYGYSSALTLFAEMMQSRGLSLDLTLKAVVSTSETLSEEQKRTLETVFRCPVANEYGARDAGILAYSCPSGGLHISAENAVIEVLDPVTLRPLPPGETGVLAVTDLGNYAQPRLRYLLGDMGALSDCPCCCGRTLPLIAALEGREDAMLIGAGGALVHGNAVGQLIRRYPGVRQFRFVQHAPDRGTLLLVLAEPGGAPTMQIVRELQALLPETRIELRVTDQIPPAPSGKMRYTVREFPLPSHP